MFFPHHLRQITTVLVTLIYSGINKCRLTRMAGDECEDETIRLTMEAIWLNKAVILLVKRLILIMYVVTTAFARGNIINCSPSRCPTINYGIGAMN